ncbi:MAG: hypothetical protein JWM28_2373, partial [Chitinophagaceae bacterium]|nr:hypothetical protein [Chitinophagaceae bacterium]
IKQSQKEQKGFIFIPDISGFTNFVNNVELAHSRHVIKELLEVILDSNQMELKVSEVEGDAILFYRFGEIPDLEVVYAQVEKMFFLFHKHLQIYESRRTCHCNACISAINLSLKIISHYGEFGEYKIGVFNKLIGKAIIIAHQLLKNDIPSHEYWLISSSLSEKLPKVFKPWMQWQYGNKKVDQHEVLFHFTQLSQLKKNELTRRE